MFLTDERKIQIENIANSIIEKYKINPFNFDIIYFLRKDYNFDINLHLFKNRNIDLILLVNDDLSYGNLIREIAISSIQYSCPESVPYLRHRMLHMFGHYILHREGNQAYAVKDYIDGSAYNDKYKELEADYFSEVMLMPENAIKTIVPFCKHNLDKIQTIKHMFNVSEKIARNRLYDLELIEIN